MTDIRKTIQELSEDIKNRRITSTELVRQALAGIAAKDQDGKKLNTVSEISPFCLFEAEAADREIAAGHIRGPLHGIPFLVKDNIDVKGLHTTAGSYALRDLIAHENSPLITNLKEAGAIILGKANLSEFAYWMSTTGMPSGYSSMSGQVVHALNPSFDPSGSSSGSAVAVSAHLVPGAVGTETCGSLMSPGIANAIVSLKPTVGLISRTGIIPISHSQDTAGPMTNTVTDCALMLSAMAGRDAADPATLRIPESVLGFSYENILSGDLSGKRIGVYTDDANPRTDKEEQYQTLLKQKIEAAGGTVVEIHYENTDLDCEDILTYEFRNGIDRYLAAHNCTCRTLSDIISFNAAHSDHCLVHGQDLLIKSNAVSGLLKETDYLTKRLDTQAKGRALIDDVIRANDLYCLVTACGGISSFAAVYGTCSMVLPAAPFHTEVYEPVSYFLVGAPWTEANLLHTAYALEN